MGGGGGGKIQPITYYVLDEQNLADKMFIIIHIITTGKLRMYVFMILFSCRLSLLLWHRNGIMRTGKEQNTLRLLIFLD